MSNVNWMGFVALALSLLVFHLTYRRLAGRGAKLHWLVATGCGVMAVPSILAALYYLHVLPEEAWFYQMRALRGSEFFILFLGAASAALAAALPRVILPVLLFLLGCTGVVPYLKPLYQPLDETRLRSSWENGGCLQSSESTCGPASMVTILHSLGVEVTEKEIAHAAHTYGGGTEAWYLARYVRSKGLKTRFQFSEDFTGFPALVGVRVSGHGHFIALLSVSGNECVISDPLYGMEHLTLRDFRQRYEFTGFRMRVSR